MLKEDGRKCPLVNSRRKGASFERELAIRMREVFPGVGVRRGIQYRSGSEAADVEHPYFWVEAKRGRKPLVRAALSQASDATDGRKPLVVIRDDRQSPFVVMWLDDLLPILEEWWRWKETQSRSQGG